MLLSVRKLPIFFFLFALSACGSPFSSAGKQFSSAESSSDASSFPGSFPDTNSGSFKPSICSPLSFDNVQWPSEINNTQLNALALAMNISGSFEGAVGWSNLSNNFDGQGVSLGLFNQNLGSGSLQPLLIAYRDLKTDNLRSIFSTSQTQSLSTMLKNWGTSSDGLILTKASTQEDSVSALDDPKLLGLPTLQSKTSTLNQDSVNWAISNLYNGTQFKPEWKTALQNLAETPDYISIQVAAGKKIHAKAMSYLVKYGLRQLRSYLFYFDIVVQNGGIPSTIETQYLAWEKNNKAASETTKLKKMLEYRLTVVRSEYVQDVRERKTAVINGFGTVHSSDRNFPVEFCAPSWSTGVR